MFPSISRNVARGRRGARGLHNHLMLMGELVAPYPQISLDPYPPDRPLTCKSIDEEGRTREGRARPSEMIHCIAGIKTPFLSISSSDDFES